MGIFSCPCCVSWWWACACGSLVSLLKLSQPGSCWQAGKYWELYWETCFSENIGKEAVAILDNSYIKCYNKCNDDNKNVISHQTGKNAPTRRFCL